MLPKSLLILASVLATFTSAASISITGKDIELQAKLLEEKKFKDAVARQCTRQEAYAKFSGPIPSTISNGAPNQACQPLVAVEEYLSYLEGIVVDQEFTDAMNKECNSKEITFVTSLYLAHYRAKGLVHTADLPQSVNYDVMKGTITGCKPLRMMWQYDVNSKRSPEEVKFFDTVVRECTREETYLIRLYEIDIQKATGSLFAGPIPPRSAVSDLVNGRPDTTCQPLKAVEDHFTEVIGDPSEIRAWVNMMHKKRQSDTYGAA
ncbi:hypothetical protein C0993_007428 [Termitomyces sp. T159_Od127]|nr:hypothetical protein C0993_007428 [Termitomyces sp. T159_Od127]